MTHYNRQFGSWGEQVAAQYLEMRGFTILDRNYRTPYGEIDLIAQKEDMIIFVEVKTRSGKEFGMPEDAITPKKREHLTQCAQYYWLQYDDEKVDWRIDVISIITIKNQTQPEVTWFENAVV